VLKKGRLWNSIGSVLNTLPEKPFSKTLPGQLLIIKLRNQPGVALGDTAGVLPGAGFCA